MSEQHAQFVLRNYTETARVERRLYSIGDWILPFAVPVRALVLFLIMGIPLWLTLQVFGVSLGGYGFWIYSGPPGLGAYLLYALRVQGKSMGAVADAHARFVWWWLLHHNDTTTKRFRLLCVAWRPTHPAYSTTVGAAHAEDS